MSSECFWCGIGKLFVFLLIIAVFWGGLLSSSLKILDLFDVKLRVDDDIKIVGNATKYGDTYSYFVHAASTWTNTGIKLNNGESIKVENILGKVTTGLPIPAEFYGQLNSVCEYEGLIADLDACEKFRECRNKQFKENLKEACDDKRKHCMIAYDVVCKGFSLIEILENYDYSISSQTNQYCDEKRCYTLENQQLSNEKKQEKCGEAYYKNYYPDDYEKIIQFPLKSLGLSCSQINVVSRFFSRYARHNFVDWHGQKEESYVDKDRERPLPQLPDSKEYYGKFGKKFPHYSIDTNMVEKSYPHGALLIGYTEDREDECCKKMLKSKRLKQVKNNKIYDLPKELSTGGYICFVVNDVDQFRGSNIGFFQILFRKK